MQQIVEKSPQDIVRQIMALEPKLKVVINAKLSLKKQEEIRTEYVGNVNRLYRLLKQAKDEGLGDHATIERLLKKYAIS